jgi:hypothetical protein
MPDYSSGLAVGIGCGIAIYPCFAKLLDKFFLYKKDILIL